eukprot:gene4680-8252_t
MKFFLILLVSVLVIQTNAKYFPDGEKWEKYTDQEIEKKGWNIEKLNKLKEFKLLTKTESMMIIQDGKIIFEHGKTNKKFISKSVRKSLLSSILSMEIDKGKLKLEQTLKDLKIDDYEPKLSELEKSTTIEYLLRSTSGVYHDAIYEMSLPKKPQRDSKKPGEYFLYNNWDYNTLGSIFEQVSNDTIYNYFFNNVAKKIGMTDFKGKEITSLMETKEDKYPPFTADGDGFYVYGDKSKHKAYLFLISARDLAKFGLLMLNNGNWNGNQIISEKWVQRISSYEHKNFDFMFWTDNKWLEQYSHNLPLGIYSALGDGCQTIFVIPQWNIVFTHMTDTAKPYFNNSEYDRAWDEFGCLFSMMLNSFYPLKVNKENEFCSKWLEADDHSNLIFISLLSYGIFSTILNVILILAVLIGLGIVFYVIRLRNSMAYKEIE